MSARENILGRIRRLQRKPAVADAAEREAVAASLRAAAPGPLPGDEREPVARFRERAAALSTTCEDAVASAEAPAAVARYLRQQNLPLAAVCWPELAALDWAGAGLAVEARAARDGDLVGISGAWCAIAETGTLVTLSGAATPPSVSLLPETHIAVVSRARIVRAMEDAWRLLRAERGAPPRAVHFISGPSRTADIEQTVTLGAHGPYRVHVILVP